MAKRLRLYVWEEALQDWTFGVMFALASSPEEARAQIKIACSYVPEHEFDREPVAYDSPVGFAVWGGG